MKYSSSDSPLSPKLIAVNLRCCLGKRKHHSIFPLDGYVEVEDCSGTGIEHFKILHVDLLGLCNLVRVAAGFGYRIIHAFLHCLEK